MILQSSNLWREIIPILTHSTGLVMEKNLFAVKSPVFSMSKLSEVDTYLGPEMKSTGELWE